MQSFRADKYHENLVAEVLFSHYNQDIMKGFDEAIPFIVAILVAAALFLGVVTAIKNLLKPSPEHQQ